MTNGAQPSVNPPNTGSLQGMMEHVMQKVLQRTDDMLPATVIDFDRATNRARVQPQILMVNTDGQSIRRAAVASVPVFQIGAGGFVLNFNLKAGDLGWIKASDRDISLFMQSFQESPPNTFRLHSFEDGVFFPNVLSGFTINSEDAENCVLQTLDGSQRIAIWEDRVKITSDQDIILDAPLVTITGDLITGTDTGGLGTATFNGTVRVTEDVIGDYDGDSISLNDHVHINAGGTGDSGPPKP